MKCIESSLLHLAADEGDETALRAAQNIQLSLETIVEAGNRTEVDLASNLLRRVNRAIGEINEGTLVRLIRAGDEEALNNEILRRVEEFRGNLP
jgi:hypothetical protein